MKTLNYDYPEPTKRKPLLTRGLSPTGSSWVPLNTRQQGQWAEPHISKERAKPIGKNLEWGFIWKTRSSPIILPFYVWLSTHDAPQPEFFNMLECHFPGREASSVTLKRCSMIWIEIFRKGASSKPLVNQKLPFPPISPNTHAWVHAPWLLVNQKSSPILPHDFQKKQLSV